MKNSKSESSSSRRKFFQTTAVALTGLSIVPYWGDGNFRIYSPPPTNQLFKRTLGRIGFEVTTMGLGGQAAIQWTPEGVDPVEIITKAHKLGINYFDTSNLYGPSQMIYGKAFRQLGLVVGEPNYDPKRRAAIFLTSKTHLRFSKGGDERKDVNGWSNGPAGSKTLDDVRRTLSQIFGDGKGKYPAGAYLDMVLIHSLSSMAEVDAVYEGYDHPDPKSSTIGALAALRDVRDGTNRTGLNPEHEKLIRHIGFSGHHDAAAMIEMIQRDHENLLEGMLIAVNANDKVQFNMQYNVLPVAIAKNMGIIGMKVFADGAMYSKKAEWSNSVGHVVQKVGGSEISCSDLIHYTLTTPGIQTAIIGIGMISEDPSQCQLVQNLAASQISPGDLSDNDRYLIEQKAGRIKEGKTNYFQLPDRGLTPPREFHIEKEGTTIRLNWHTPYAGDAPLNHFEISKNGQMIGKITFTPQTSKSPYQFLDRSPMETGVNYTVKIVDSKGRTAETSQTL